jgi:hypothetical protein
MNEPRQTAFRLWTEAEITIVRDAWAAGETAAEITLRLNGRSRCAIIGIVNRNRMKRGGGAPVARLPVRRVIQSRSHLRSQIASYYATQDAPITLAGPAWSHPQNARAA